MCPADIWDGRVDHAVARLNFFRSSAFGANMPFVLQGIQTVMLNGVRRKPVITHFEPNPRLSLIHVSVRICLAAVAGNPPAVIKGPTDVLVPISLLPHCITSPHHDLGV
jgi:hypothetical protein